MTQAFNLSQLANRVNTSGQLNIATGVSGTLAIGNGGTGVTAVGAAGNVLTSNGTAWVSQAASAGFSGATVNSPSATALTLTNASAQCQIIQFTSPANSIVNLPSATTLLYKGAPIYRLINESQCNAPIFVRDALGNWLATIPVNEAVDLTLEDNSTSAGSWMVDAVDQLPTPAAVENASISQVAQTANANYQNNPYYSQSPVACALTDSTYVFAWGYSGATTPYSYCAIVAATLSGNTFSFGAVNYNAPIGNLQAGRPVCRVFRLNNTTAIVEFRAGNQIADCVSVTQYYYNRCAAVTVSGNSVTLGAWNSSGFPEGTTANNGNGAALDFLAHQGFRFRISDTHFASVYHTTIASWNIGFLNNGAGNLNCMITSVSGTTQTNGAAATLAANNGNILGATSHTDGAFIITYTTQSSAGAATGIRKAVTCNTSGTTATWGTVTQIDISNITTSASLYQYGNGVTLSSTKVCLPTYQTTGSGNLWTISTFTISGNTNTYVTGSDCNMETGNFMLYPRTASGFLAKTQTSFNTWQSGFNPSNISFKYMGVNANNAVFPDTNYTFQNNSQSGGTFATDWLAPPATTTSTVGVQISSLYVTSPAGTVIYASRGVLPT